MPDENKAAQTIEPVVEKAVETPEVVVKDADLEKAKAEQIESVNREEARKRRDREAEQALEKREIDTVIRITGGLNPFTNSKIEDREDMEEFYLMKKIEKSGGDPIADYAKALKEQRKAEKEKNETASKSEMNKEQAAEDMAKFQTAHPNITLKSLMADQDFLDYADGKIGKKPLSTIYDGYLKLLGKKNPEIKEDDKIVKPSPGALNNPAKIEPEYFTKSQLEKFTAQELHKMTAAEFAKVTKSREHWAKQK